MMKRFLLISIICFSNDVFAQTAPNPLLVGDWIGNIDFILFEYDKHDNFYYRSDFSYRYYVENTFSAPLMESIYRKYDSLESQKIMITYKFHRRRKEDLESMVDSSNMYIHHIKLFPPQKWVLNEGENGLQIHYFGEKGKIDSVDILHLDKESLLTAFDDIEKKDIHFYFYLKAGIDNRKYFKDKNKYFLVPYIEKYFLKKKINITRRGDD